MNKFTKLDESGSVSVSASVSAYAAALTEWVAANEVPVDQIASAVDAVLNSFPGKNLPMPALISKTIEQLNSDPAQFNTLSKRVHAFVKGQATAGVLTVSKGSGGGVGRVVAQ